MKRKNLPRKKGSRGSSPPSELVGLFAGIGGFELGFGTAGLGTSLLCEIDTGAQAVLEHHFPGILLHPDVSTLRTLPRSADLLAAGFPCQDLSQAGRTAGIGGSKSGIIAEVFRLLEGRRLPWVVLENVPFMLQLGGGRALDYILGALERLGYRWAYRIVDTLAFGLPQRRQRVFIVASCDGDPRDVLLADDVGVPHSRPSVTRPSAFGFYWTEGLRGLGLAVDAVPTLKGGSTVGIPSPPAILFRSGLVATPDIRDAERLQGFAVDWTLPAEQVLRRSYRWKLVGNAVTVNVAAWLGRRLISPGKYEPKLDLPLGKRTKWPKAAWSLGDGRFAASVSTRPVTTEGAALSAFLEFEPKPLSERATAGFLSRAKISTLRFPAGFLDSVTAHLAQIRSPSQFSVASG